MQYEPDGSGHQQSVADHTYGYSDALADGVVRPVVFMAYSGEARWRDSAGEEHAARLGEPLTAEQTARAWRTALKNPDTKYRWHRWLLNAPLYGKFERSLNTARFASTLAITTGSGVPILRALQTSRDTLSNVAMREQVEEATAAVREGVGLARALSAHKHFPPMLIHMIRAGEVTGELPAMLQRASDAQEADLERRAMTIAG